MARNSIGRQGELQRPNQRLIRVHREMVETNLALQILKGNAPSANG